MADLSKLSAQAVLDSLGPNLSKLSAFAVLDSAINASNLSAFVVLDGTSTVPVPPGGGGGGGGGGSHGGGGGGGSGGKGGGKGGGKQKATSAKAWAKGFFSTTWLQVIARRKFVAVITETTPTPTPTETTRPTGGARHHPQRPVKFRGRFYRPDKDRYALARDVQAFLEEQTPAPDLKPLTVKVEKKTVVLPAVALTEREIVDFEAIARELKLKKASVDAYVASLRELAHRIEMENEEEAVALLLAA